jgi:hypothetical protein
VEKSSPRIFATSVIFNQLAKVNNRPMGKNTSNLVTLVARAATAFVFFAGPTSALDKNSLEAGRPDEFVEKWPKM